MLFGSATETAVKPGTGGSLLLSGGIRITSKSAPSSVAEVLPATVTVTEVAFSIR